MRGIYTKLEAQFIELLSGICLAKGFIEPSFVDCNGRHCDLGIRFLGERTSALTAFSCVAIDKLLFLTAPARLPELSAEESLNPPPHRHRYPPFQSTAAPATRGQVASHSTTNAFPSPTENSHKTPPPLLALSLQQQQNIPLPSVQEISTLTITFT